MEEKDRGRVEREGEGKIDYKSHEDHHSLIKAAKATIHCQVPI